MDKGHVNTNFMLPRMPAGGRVEVVYQLLDHSLDIRNNISFRKCIEVCCADRVLGHTIMVLDFPFSPFDGSPPNADQ